MQACLSARKDLVSIFHNCGSPVEFVQASLSTGKDLYEAVFTTVDSCGSRGDQFKYLL